MRQPFAHSAVLDMAGEADLGAPGAAITVELCGDWEHPPPCPLAPHHTDAGRDGDVVRLRILFAAEADAETTVRERIHAALASGQLGETRWRLRESAADAVRPAERDHAARLAAGS